jgi:hypothetical protein
MDKLMQNDLPDSIKEIGFDFDWSEKKVWALHVPVAELGISELEWHFDIPFLDEKEGRYNLTPREVMEHPEDHPEEYARTLAADMRYPLDLMENPKIGKLEMLDGLHRLMKA